MQADKVKNNSDLYLGGLFLSSPHTTKVSSAHMEDQIYKELLNFKGKKQFKVAFHW